MGWRQEGTCGRGDVTGMPACDEVQAATVGCRKDVLDLGWVLRRCSLSFILDIPFWGGDEFLFTLLF